MWFIQLLGKHLKRILLRRTRGPIGIPNSPFAVPGGRGALAIGDAVGGREKAAGINGARDSGQTRAGADIRTK